MQVSKLTHTQHGFNAQEHAKNKVDKYKTYADNAKQRSTEWYEKSNMK